MNREGKVVNEGGGLQERIFKFLLNFVFKPFLLRSNCIAIAVPKLLFVL